MLNLSWGLMKRESLQFFKTKGHFMQISISMIYGVHLSDCQNTVLTWLERCLLNQQILQKKEHSCIFYISNFVKEENQHLIIHDGEGNIIKDA